MTESSSETALAEWSVPECPFTIEYSTRVLDDIRLAVVDAFFSLPRGGAEIGGILTGSYQNRRLVISDFVALDCEHAMGPSFTLSPRDLARFAELIAAAGRNVKDARPVGWYHSHTRSEVFLSDADQEIHKRFFHEPWHVALVLKPHTFQPTRCGFFFREKDGSIRAEASYREFALDPLPMRPPAADGSAAAGPQGRTGEPDFPRPDSSAAPPAPNGLAVTAPPAPAPENAPVLAPPEPVVTEQIVSPVVPRAAAEIRTEPAPLTPLEPEAPVAEQDLPKFLDVQPAGPGRWVGVLIAAVAGLAIGSVGFQTRQVWLPRLTAMLRPILPAPALYLGLSTIDNGGQLQIRWDRNSPAVTRGVYAVLEIVDGGGPLPQTIRLDSGQLQSGTFTYGRQHERVDVAMVIDQPNGQQVREIASFLGKLPEPKAAGAENPAVQPRNDADEAARLKKELSDQAVRTKKLEKSVEELHKQLQDQKHH